MNFLGIEFGGCKPSVELDRHSSAGLNLERGSERFSWKRDLIRLGIVVGAMAVGGFVVGGLASYIAYNMTGEIGKIWVAATFVGTLGGMLGGMELGNQINQRQKA